MKYDCEENRPLIARVSSENKQQTMDWRRQFRREMRSNLEVATH